MWLAAWIVNRIGIFPKFPFVSGFTGGLHLCELNYVKHKDRQGEAKEEVEDWRIFITNLNE